MIEIFRKVISIIILGAVIIACGNSKFDAPKNVVITEDQAFGIYTLAWSHPWQYDIDTMNTMFHGAWGFEIEETVNYGSNVELHTYYARSDFQHSFEYLYPDAQKVIYRVRGYIATMHDGVYLGEWSTPIELINH